ncbi:HIT-like protein [Morchella conica CCBAS932]|uniref:HIT-like protein n=1 Tax=Morchella conica CCBAS932 TaxID=1392247 RepID=A0A3N4KWS7_9PEZI|nr:HIT-like protein [Morchella conica CCBAS932]
MAAPASNPDSCPFCTIAASFPPHPPSSPHAAPAAPLDPPTHIILATPHVMAFLDIQPLTRGHVLVCPRAHKERLTDLTPAQSGGIGAWLPVVARAVVKVVGVGDFNVVQNNGWCLCSPSVYVCVCWRRADGESGVRWAGVHAAQVVPHVHYHIIPRPSSEEREKLLAGAEGRWLLSRLDLNALER